MSALWLCFLHAPAFSQAFVCSGAIRDARTRHCRRSAVAAVGSGNNWQAAEEWLLKAKRSHAVGEDAATMRFCEKSLRLSESGEATVLARSVRDAMLVARVRKAPADFAVLQLSRFEAECLTDLKAAYKKRARLVHPDSNCAQQAQAAFVRVQRAYEALKPQVTAQQRRGAEQRPTAKQRHEEAQRAERERAA